jgi:acyl-CoA synthetase (AMP-forming)/AMP-acid ligase II
MVNALAALGVGEGDRVATLAWNGYRHFELYYAVSGMGAVLHTINPRLFPDQIAYIVNHAEDSYVFVDLTFVPLVEALAGKLDSVKGFVIMTDAAQMPDTTLGNVLCYETLLADRSDDYAWPVLDEGTGSSLCYSSGTTGNPKGVLYSHRSTVLHSYAICMADTVALSSLESVLPVVPMFHVNAWGIPYAAALCGAKLVFPGPGLDGASVHALLESEAVTLTAAVPTVWLMLLAYLKESGKTLTALKRVVVGGAAVPRSMIQTFEEDYGVRMVHAGDDRDEPDRHHRHFAARHGGSAGREAL